MAVVRCLSMHAAYRCAHSGACCTSRWPIEFAAGEARAVGAAMDAGRIAARGTRPLAANPDGRIIAAQDERGCAFHDDKTRRCEIHRALGHDALPLACRQFPRITLQDPRGIALTLSHYCPTAAALLFDDRPVTIVESAAAFPADGEHVGLDARDVLPPLLRDGLLMDWDAWWDLERLAVEVLGNYKGEPAAALARLAGAIRRLQDWTPAEPQSLRQAVERAFSTAMPAPEPLVLGDAFLEDEMRGPAASPQPRPANRVVNRFLAAHAFANWTAYGRTGVDGWFRSIARAYAFVEALGVRDADLWLRHRAE